MSNIFSLGMLQVVNYILPIIVIPFLVSTIGLENVGILATVSAVISYFQICIDYGFSLTATRAIAKANNDTNQKNLITSSVILIKLTLATLLFMFFLVIIETFNSFKGLGFLFILAYVTAIVNSLFPQWHFQGIEKMHFITITNTIPKVLTTLVLFLLVRDKSDVILVQWCYLIGALITLLWAYGILKTKESFSLRFSVESYKEQLSYGKNIFFARLFSTLYKNSNILIIGLFVSPTLVGVYTIAERIVRSCQTMQNVIGDSIYPKVAAGSNLSFKYLNFNNKKYIAYITGFYAFSSLAFLLFSDIIAKILVKNDWADISHQLKIMSCVFFFGGLNYFFGILGLVARGYNFYFSGSVLITGIANIFLCFYLTSQFSISGASISMVLSEVILLLMIIFFLKKVKEPIR
ncbi:oligosaccharide flippase family protein [Cronobacter sakazakii]|uniref:oligosaccharide flippase family protein n=1 Tax=Cronobacter sakazakii TaxID=28141 RepID=UPI002234BFC7|nr:oligosaccharide flippase family protein [Cronobacter sakazakii]